MSRKIASENDARLWRDRERQRALRRFNEELDRAATKLKSDMDFIATCTVFDEGMAISGGSLGPDASP